MRRSCSSLIQSLQQVRCYSKKIILPPELHLRRPFPNLIPKLRPASAEKSSTRMAESSLLESGSFSALMERHSKERSPQVGEVRTLPDSDSELPVGKKPRIEASDETEANDVVQKDVPKKKKTFGKQVKKEKSVELCSNEDVLFREASLVLGQEAVDKAIAEGTDLKSPFEYHAEVEVEIQRLGANGEGLGTSPETLSPWTIVVPLSLPGEKVRARIYKDGRMYSLADRVETISPNLELRDNSRVQCKYFGECAGCQYQMLSYETQLNFKQNVIINAYKMYSNISEGSMPSILSTMPSPLSYGYRTKLTPHFEAPSKRLRQQKNKVKVPPNTKPEWFAIGFNKLGTHKTMDIEDCPIATSTVRKALGPARETAVRNIWNYKKGVSLIFRDSLDTKVDIDPRTARVPIDKLSEEFNKHVCVTDHKGTVREKVGDYVFEYIGSTFFQNNNSVLPSLTQYVEDLIFPPDSPASATSPTHLVDTYCGAGLFAITLSKRFEKVAGVEVSDASIRFATRNARLNSIPDSKISFRAGDASDIFRSVKDFPPDQTVVVIDPPRKGCDDAFLEQLLKFRCKTLVYVSCNVHSQARDVGKILKATEDAEPGQRYSLEHLRGFDLFPQTAHVESVALLKLV